MKKMLCCFIMVVLLAGCASLPQRLMSDEDPVRGKAVSDFNGLTKEAKIKTFAEITRNFENEDLPVRIKTMRGLSEELYEIKKSSEFVSFLVKALKDPSPAVRLRALDLIPGKIDYGDSDLIPALLEVLKNDQDERVSLGALKVISLHEQLNKSLVSPIAELIKRLGPSDTCFCYGVLGKIGRDAVPTIMGLMQDKSEFSECSFNALAEIGVEAQEAVSMLEKISEDERWGRSAMEALKKIDFKKYQDIEKRQAAEAERKRKQEEAEAKRLAKERAEQCPGLYILMQGLQDPSIQQSIILEHGPIELAKSAQRVAKDWKKYKCSEGW